MWRRKSSPRPRPSDAPGNEPGHVGDGERVDRPRPLARPARHGLHDTEVGRQRGERVVGDLRLGRGQDRHQRRLARRREADQPDVGDGLQLQDELALLAGLAEQGKTGALRALEASAAFPSPHDRPARR